MILLAASSFLVFSCNSSPTPQQTIPVVEPESVSTTWQFETVYHPSQLDSLGLDGSRVQVDLTFDRNGDLRAIFCTRQNVYYTWRDKTGWHNERVDNFGCEWHPRIVFDLENQPHIFYTRNRPMGTKLWIEISPPMHAFKTQEKWIVEEIPTPYPPERYDWSQPVISPEGWPVVLRNNIHTVPERTVLMYFTFDGWKTIPIPEIPSTSPNPIIGFIGNNATYTTTSAGNITLPHVFFRFSPPVYAYTPQPHQIIFRDLMQGKDIILPQLPPNQHLSLGSFPPIWWNFHDPTSLVFFETVYGSGAIDDLPALNILTLDLSDQVWITEQIKGFVPLWSTSMIDAQGYIHIVGENYQASGSVVYLTGHDLNWQVSNIKGDNYSLTGIYLGSTALRQDGEFCISFGNMQASEMVVGCLDTASK